MANNHLTEWLIVFYDYKPAMLPGVARFWRMNNRGFLVHQDRPFG
jgi:hypothetical protein